MSIVCAVLLSATFAYAATLPTGQFAVRPAKVEITANPGEEKTTILTLSNGTALPLQVDVSFEDIGPSTQNTALDEPVKLLGKEGGMYPMRELFSTSKSRIEVISGEEAQVPITVRVPKDAEAGGRYGSVVLTFKPIIKEGGAQAANVSFESRIATTFFLRVAGETKEEGELVEFGLFNKAKTVRSPSADAPLRFQIAYENKGDVHLDPYGGITISPFFGDDQKIVVDPWAVLPGATRMREIDLSTELPIGYYTAHLDLNRGYKDIVDVRDVSFWVVPGPEGMLVIVVVLIGLIWLVRRSLALSKHFIS